jgi:hypothetical protein
MFLNQQEIDPKLGRSPVNASDIRYPWKQPAA